MSLPQSKSWLDPETQASLQKCPPLTVAPSTTDGFSVVVLHHSGTVDDRGLHALQAGFNISREAASHLGDKWLPFIGAQHLPHADAMLAQFELICCDIISVFIADSVIDRATPQYLADLYNSLIRGSEFSPLTVRVKSIPETEAGTRFTSRFIADHPVALPYTMMATFKKARVMQHWASSFGINLSTRP